MGSVPVMRTNSKAMPINDNNYSCHIAPVELANQLHGVHIMPQVINNTRGGWTHTDAHTETILRTRCAPATGQHAPGLKPI